MEKEGYEMRTIIYFAVLLIDIILLFLLSPLGLLEHWMIVLLAIIFGVGVVIGLLNLAWENGKT